ncbi:MAG: transcription elongation factor GreA [Christensenellales bacterium]|jgi:transcription elongation factor GreA
MSEREVLLTAEGVAELEAQLDYLKTVRRPEISEQIKEARAFGDISENAEYDEAKNEQAKIEGEIAKLEKKLRTARIIDDNSISTDVVGIGSVVKLLDAEYNEEVEYCIVGSAEADPARRKISSESPVGMALMGASKGDTVDVMTPGGLLQLKIIEIGK